ncbi:hypothetical protein M8U16_15915 [Enterobacter hormaechei]|uniref:hypothetical protein n=1 Tax=Enterobacter hormaechei TaxID=158836 RepID=UPI00101B73DB|nr:hypothetical protein [Enterobacter hormaechei]EKS6455937.1 hypothetical protein [Enterobacter hormaechei]MCM8117130.1 hypothetical protein [Enterobacter hormaechei]RYH61298.1 hypothetical protein EVY07_08895 [Enterobacter hormaechei]
MKHTPAPWYFSNEGVLRVRAKDDDEVVCSYAGYENCEREYANAKLIAAAPDLLEALQDALHAYDKHGEHPEWDFARAAISKALGEE